MRFTEISQFVNVKGNGPGGQRQRLSRCQDVFDLREAARRRIPRQVFDYVDGGSEEELSVAANLAAYRSRRFLLSCPAGASPGPFN